MCPPSSEKTVLDIGCGEGKDAVYMAQKGYNVTAFDLTENGIRKTIALAEDRNVNIKAYVDDINTFCTDIKRLISFCGCMRKCLILLMGEHFTRLLISH